MPMHAKADCLVQRVNALFLKFICIDYVDLNICLSLQINSIYDISFLLFISAKH